MSFGDSHAPPPPPMEEGDMSLQRTLKNWGKDSFGSEAAERNWVQGTMGQFLSLMDIVNVGWEVRET